MWVVPGYGAPKCDAAIVTFISNTFAFCAVSGLSNVRCEKGQPAPAAPDGDEA